MKPMKALEEKKIKLFNVSYAAASDNDIRVLKILKEKERFSIRQSLSFLLNSMESYLSS